MNDLRLSFLQLLIQLVFFRSKHSLAVVSFMGRFKQILLNLTNLLLLLIVESLQSLNALFKFAHLLKVPLVFLFLFLLELHSNFRLLSLALFRLFQRLLNCLLILHSFQQINLLLLLKIKLDLLVLRSILLYVFFVFILNGAHLHVELFLDCLQHDILNAVQFVRIDSLVELHLLYHRLGLYFLVLQILLQPFNLSLQML